MRGESTPQRLIPLLVVVFLMAIVGGVAGLAQADDEATTAHAASHESKSRPSGWEFDLGTYVWLPAVRGHVTVDGQRIPIDADVVDIIKDSDSLFALNLVFLASKGRWGLLVNPQYMQVGFDGQGAFNVKLIARILIAETTGLYTFLERTLGSSRRAAISVDAIFGVRLWWLGVSVTAVEGLISGENFELWLDPLAGLIFRVDLLDGHLAVRARGDFGGWGVGSSIAWAAVGSVGYRWFLRRLDVTLELAYRALGPNYSNDSDGFGFDAVLHGPGVGVAFRF